MVWLSTTTCTPRQPRRVRRGAGSQRGFGANEGGWGGGGVGQSLIPTQPTHVMKREKSDVGDVVEGGHLRVGREDPQVIPPLRSGGLPLKGGRTMVPLRITGTEVLVHSNHIHARGAVDEVSGGVDGANHRFQLARPMHRHDPQEGVNHFEGREKADGPQLGEGQRQLLPRLCGPPLFAERTRTLGFPSCQYG